MATETVKLGELEIDLSELSHFLVKAKKHCYAGEGEEILFNDGSKELIFQEGNFHYTDNYAGWYQAPGQEIVRWKKQYGQRIWTMAYSGGMTPELIGDEETTIRVFNFLKKALNQVAPEEPFRGPRYLTSIFEAKGFNYLCNIHGDVTTFSGDETIFEVGRGSVFKQNFIGGLIIPKK